MKICCMPQKRAQILGKNWGKFFFAWVLVIFFYKGVGKLKFLFSSIFYIFFHLLWMCLQNPLSLLALFRTQVLSFMAISSFSYFHTQVLSIIYSHPGPALHCHTRQVLSFINSHPSPVLHKFTPKSCPSLSRTQVLSSTISHPCPVLH